MSKKKTKKDLINLEDNQEEKEITTTKLKETKKNEIKKDNQEEIKESKDLPENVTREEFNELLEKVNNISIEYNF